MDVDPILNTGNTPKHVAIIMDGNGRWAKARGLSRDKGHRAGVENVREIIPAAKELGIEHLTLYAFSAENWNRPKAEIQALMMLLERFLKAELKTMIEKQIRFLPIGKIDELPPKIYKLLNEAIEKTAHFTKQTLSLALNYGSRLEVVEAAKRYAEKVKSGEESTSDLTWDKFSGFLYTKGIPDPDLVIRTSGEKRISNFLLLQSAYAEYYFVEENWPDFNPEAFHKAICDYARRERRFGKTGDQIKNINS